MFAAKHQPTPTAAITTPPSAGPAIRAMLKSVEFSATAFGSSVRPTIWKVRLWRAGASSTSAVPVSAAIAYTCQAVTWPASASMASTALSTICTDCVKITVLRLSSRSAITPACRPKSVNGPKRQRERIPTATGMCVSCRTSQYMATFCIHVPLTEITCPVKNRR